MKKNYRIFISHSWQYSDTYEKLIELLDAQGLSYYNHSVPIKMILCIRMAQIENLRKLLKLK